MGILGFRVLIHVIQGFQRENNIVLRRLQHTLESSRVMILTRQQSMLPIG